MARVSIDKAYRRATNKECCCCPEDNNNILTPPTTRILGVNGTIITFENSNGAINGNSCTSFSSQVLEFGIDGINYPLIVNVAPLPNTATDYDVCYLDVSQLIQSNGTNTLFVRSTVVDCGGNATSEYNNVTVDVSCQLLECAVSSSGRTLDYAQQELIAKPSATEVVWRITSSNATAHNDNLIILNYLSGNPNDRWIMQDVPGFVLWWTGLNVQVIGVSGLNIDVLINTQFNGWNGNVNIDTCRSEINDSDLDDEENKVILQGIYDTIPIGTIQSGEVIPFRLFQINRSANVCTVVCNPQVLYDCWNFGTDEYDIMEPNYSGNFIHAVSEVKVNGTVINFAPLNTWLDVKSLLQAYANVASVGDNVGVSTDLIFNMSTISGTISSISLKFDVIGEFPLTQLSFGDANTCTAAGAATYMCWNKFYPNVFDNTNTGTFQPNVVDIRINGASIMSGATSLSTLDDVIAMLLSDSRVIGVSNNATSEPNLDLTISTIQGVSSIVVETAAPVLITFDLIASNEAVPCAIDHFISYRCWVKNGASNGDCAPDPCFNLTGVVVDDVYYPFSAVVNTFAAFEAEMSALPIGFAGYTYQLMTDSVFAIVLNSKKANINVGVYYDGYTYPDPDGLQLLEDFTPPQPKLTICSF